MRIEAVTVCVGYADFLAETLPFNMHHFDALTVVTSYDDRETRNVCNRLSVDCRPTDVMFKSGDGFNKGRAIDFGLGYIRGSDWLVHLDADIYLPPMTRQWLNWAELDRDCIYGIDRVECCGYENWTTFRSGYPRHQHQHHCLLIPPEKLDLQARLSLRSHGGFVPIGFFQLWHGCHGRRYPLSHGSAERSDVLHALQWPSVKRRLLPEIVAVHLSSESAGMGVNWNGRRTKHFGPSCCKEQGRKHHHHKKYC